jgi:threonyl-tRNA synthetase
MKYELETIRHSLAHLMAQSVNRLYKDVKQGVGPAIEDGFYQDFDIDKTITPEDLPKIESEMKKIILEDLEFKKEIISKDEALKLYKNDSYKTELITEMNDQEISVYRSGEYTDLCKGPHVKSTGELKNIAFQLNRLAGAYWRGDEKNKMMQRIYGLAFDNAKELRKHLANLEEAKKRDHRKLGKELDLFVFSDLVGKGLPLFTPKGSVIKRELERFIVDEEIKRGYQHVYTQDLAKTDLYRKSGHYPYYKDTMYPPMQIDDEELILRPMACPHHFMLYKSKPKSYRELPMRIAEIAKLYRYEKSGELTGLLRIRNFCLADSHIICQKSQAKDEIKGVLDLIDYVANVLGLKKGEDYRYRLSLGDKNNDKKYYKNDKAWDYSEKILREVLEEVKAPYFEASNEAAFYGPKIDIQMKNVAGKEDTAFTVQYDFCMPERFDLSFKNKDGKDEKAVVIHRSSIGSIERTIGFLIEKYAGRFPLWLSPVQVKIIPVSDKFILGAQKIEKIFKEENIRCEIDDRTESVGKKIAENIKEKNPYAVVIGEKEAKSGKLAVRTRGEKKIEEIEIDKFIEKLEKEIKNKK